MNTKNLNKILEILFDNPTRAFHIRELSRLTSLNPNTIINAVKVLYKERLISKQEKIHVVEVSLNLKNPEVTNKKRVFNLERIYSSGVVDFLVGKYSPYAISVLGSYSKGEDIEKSDIDIAVITNKKEPVDLENYEKKLGRKIHLLLFERKDISDEFFNSLINGILLYGVIRK